MEHLVSGLIIKDGEFMGGFSTILAIKKPTHMDNVVNYLSGKFSVPVESIIVMSVQPLNNTFVAGDDYGH